MRTQRMPLFTFEMSSHAISMTSYMREQKQEFYGEVSFGCSFGVEGNY